MAWSIVSSPQQVSLPNTDRVKIAILVPHTGNFSTEFVEKMWLPLKAGVTPWCEKQFLMSRAPSLPLARNLLLDNALKSNCEYFIWIDSDMLLEGKDPNEALRMMVDLCKQQPIVTGLYRAKQQHGFNWAIWMYREGMVCKKCQKGYEGFAGNKCPDTTCGGELEYKKGFIHIESWTGNWFEISVSGLGWLMMRREVLESIKKAYDKEVSLLDEFKVLYKGDNELIGVKTPFHWDMEGEISEDFRFLMWAKKLGYPIWCFSDIRLSHIGSLVVTTESGFRTLAV